MSPVVPPKLRPGDRVRVVAPSRGRRSIPTPYAPLVRRRLADELGLRVEVGRHVDDPCGPDDSTPVAARLEDLHEAFADPGVRGILTVIGGYNANQLLDGLDMDLVRANPTVLCGFSDITVLQWAMLHGAGLVTYSGPHWSTFGARDHFDDTMRWFRACLFADAPLDVAPADVWTDDAWFADQDDRHPQANEGWWVLQEGRGEGTLLGGNLSTIVLLHGTRWMPPLDGAVALLEDDEEATPASFDRLLQAFLHQPGGDRLAALLIGRFQRRTGMTRERLEAIVASKPQLRGVPVIAGVDVGHTHPLATFPVGGHVRVVADRDAPRVTIDRH